MNKGNALVDIYIDTLDTLNILDTDGTLDTLTINSIRIQPTPRFLWPLSRSYSIKSIKSIKIQEYHRLFKGFYVNRIGQRVAPPLAGVGYSPRVRRDPSRAINHRENCLKIGAILAIKQRKNTDPGAKNRGLKVADNFDKNTYQNHRLKTPRKLHKKRAYQGINDLQMAFENADVL